MELLRHVKVFCFAWRKRDTLQIPNDKFPTDEYATYISHEASQPASTTAAMTPKTSKTQWKPSAIAQTSLASEEPQKRAVTFAGSS